VELNALIAEDKEKRRCLPVIRQRRRRQFGQSNVEYGEQSKRHPHPSHGVPRTMRIVLRVLDLVCVQARERCEFNAQRPASEELGSHVLARTGLFALASALFEFPALASAGK
jgi:hypothetical protein